MIEESKRHPACLIVRFKNRLTPGTYHGQNRGCDLVGDLLNLGSRVFVGPWGVTVVCKWASDRPRVHQQLQELLKNWRWQFSLKLWGNA